MLLSERRLAGGISLPIWTLRRENYEKPKRDLRLLVKLAMKLVWAVCLLLGCISDVPACGANPLLSPAGVNSRTPLARTSRSTLFNPTLLNPHMPSQAYYPHREQLVPRNRRQQDSRPKSTKRGGGGSVQLLPSRSFDVSTHRFTNFGMIVPVVLAASYIQDFFGIIALRIETGFWANEPPSSYRIFSMWNFELSFISAGTTIPWDFIQEYVIDKSSDVCKGFTGVFEEEMVGVLNGVAAAILIKLKFVGEIAGKP